MPHSLTALIDAARRQALVTAGWTRLGGAVELWTRPGEYGVFALDSAYALMLKRAAEPAPRETAP